MIEPLPFRLMSEPHTGVRTLTSELPLMYMINETLFRQRCTALGAHTDHERCQAAGISRATLNRWRRGVRNPQPALMRQTSTRLGCPRDELFREVVA
jgi:transcriptional regulator with XRE-family HTH domain